MSGCTGTLARAALWLLWIVLWVGGVVSLLAWGAPPSNAGWTAPAFLVIAALLALWGEERDCRLPLLGAAAIALLSEMSGVRWGTPFGDYAYSPALSARPFFDLGGVPLAIPAAWLLLLAWARALFATHDRAPAKRILAVALAMTAADLLIDPVASGPLGYWTWKSGGAWFGVPPGNFRDWLIVSALLAFVSGSSDTPNRSALLLGRGTILFFTILAAANGLWVPACTGGILLLLASKAR